MSDVDDGAEQDLVEPVSVGEPCSAVVAELAEGRAGNQGQGLPQVVQAVLAAGFASAAKPAEQVGVGEESFDLVGGASAGLGGDGLSAVGDVGAADARVGAEPGADREHVFADPVGRYPHGVGDLVGGGAVGAGGEEGEEFAEVGLAVGCCGGASSRGDPDGEGSEDFAFGQVAVGIVPGAEVVVEGWVGRFDLLTDLDWDLGREYRQVVGGGGRGLEVGLVRGTFKSVRDLTAAIRRFIDNYNKNCQPFTWTKTSEQIIKKAKRPDTSNTRH